GPLPQEGLDLLRRCPAKGNRIVGLESPLKRQESDLDLHLAYRLAHLVNVTLLQPDLVEASHEATVVVVLLESHCERLQSLSDGWLQGRLVLGCQSLRPLERGGGGDEGGFPPVGVVREGQSALPRGAGLV